MHHTWALSDAAILRAARHLLARLPDARDELLAVLNGAVGDRLEAMDASLAVPMELFIRDGPRSTFDPVEPARLARVPEGRGAVLLVHGLMGSQHAWSLGTADASDARAELGGALGEALDLSVLYLRYNSGRHVSDNGRELAARLEDLHSGWPGQLSRLELVAHSMGGLVMRSALHYGLEAGHAWPHVVRRAVLLGTPSHGASLEQLAHVAAFTLESIWNPWTKLIGKAINLRAAGIKDLRHGFCLEDDWRHVDQDVLRLQRPRPTRSPPNVRWFVAAGTQGDPEHWVGRLVGDGLVRAPSARGLGFGTAAPGVLPSAEVRVFGQTSHIALMNDPDVLQQVLAWLREGD